MTRKDRTAGIEIRSIVYTIQREGGSVHKVQRDPVDDVLTCTCAAGVYGRLCWAARMVQQGTAPKPVVRVRPLPPVRRVAVSADGRDLVDTLDVG